jgi:hypothetical protein
LYEDLQNQLRRLYDMVHRFNINGEKDKAKWEWEKSGTFSVQSVYKHLCKDEYGVSFKRMWKAKVPLKIKIFKWLVSQEAILTKDNLCKRKWKGNTTCAFCTEQESVQHIFFECLTAKYI